MKGRLAFTGGAARTAAATGSDPGVKTGVNVSGSRTYVLRLSGSVEVSVELTGMTIDFDCRVGSRRCTNNRGTADDSWSGSLKAGAYWVAVYPYDTGPGNYSLTVTATETLGFVSTPLAGGPPQLRVLVCEGDEDGGIFEDTCVEISTPGGGPGQGTPGPDNNNDDDGTPTGGPVTPQEPTEEQKDDMESDAIADATVRARNQTCLDFFKEHDKAFDLVDRVSTANFVMGDRRGRCRSTSFAYSGEGDVTNTIYTCDRFYATTRDLRADTVPHEMLHIAGESHEELGGEELFHDKVMAACP